MHTIPAVCTEHVTRAVKVRYVHWVTLPYLTFRNRSLVDIGQEHRWQWSPCLTEVRESWQWKDHLFYRKLGMKSNSTLTKRATHLDLLYWKNNSKNQEAETLDLLLLFLRRCQPDLVSGVMEKWVFPGLQVIRWAFFDIVLGSVFTIHLCEYSLRPSWMAAL